MSLIIPRLNAERWLGEAIHSAIEQTHPDLEAAAVDDGSTDGDPWR